MLLEGDSSSEEDRGWGGEEAMWGEHRGEGGSGWFVKSGVSSSWLLGGDRMSSPVVRPKDSAYGKNASSARWCLKLVLQGDLALDK